MQYETNTVAETTNETAATTEPTNETVAFPEGPLMVPTNRVALEVSENIEAEVVSVKPSLDYQGRAKVNIIFQLANGRTSISKFAHTPACRDFIRKEMKRAFNIDSLKDLPSIVGQKCNLRTDIDEFDGKVKVQYINRYNPHANDVVDLSAFDEEDAEVAATGPEILF